MAVSPSPPADAAIAQKVRLQKMVRRRRRVFWNIVLFVLVSIGMVFLVLWQRDSQAVRNARDAARELAGALQAEWNRSGSALRGTVEIAPAYRAAVSRFAINRDYGRQSAGARTVVAAGSMPIDLYLGETGRALVLFDGKTFTTDWMPEPQFRRDAESLGVVLSAEPLVQRPAASQPEK